MRSLIRICSPLLLFGLSLLNGRSQPLPLPQTEQEMQIIQVTAKKYEFNPSPIHVRKGAKVQLRITSLDKTHGFQIQTHPEGSSSKTSLGLIFTSKEECFKISKDTPAVVEFVAQTPGTYPFKCCKFCGLGHGKMKGELIVDP